MFHYHSTLTIASFHYSYSSLPFLLLRGKGSMSCYQGHGLQVTWSEQEFREFDFACIAWLLLGQRKKFQG